MYKFNRLANANNIKQIKLNTKKWFYLFCSIHLVLWTIIPYAVRGCIPFDTAESIAWGYQWQLGYDKHPPFSAWIAATATYIGGVGIATYFLAQVAIIVTFWAVFKLANKILSPMQALISVLLLEGILSFNLVSPNFNVTALMLPIWALSTYVFYLAITKQKPWHWLVFGILCAANILTKYQAPLLFLPMFLITLLTYEGRQSYKKIGIYLSVVVCIALVIPHFVWSYQHNFPEIQYALRKTTGAANISSIWKHFVHPGRILADEIGTVLPLFLMAIPFFVGKKLKPSINKFNWIFLLLIGIGPFVITLLYSLISGSLLDPNWCLAYFFTLGIIVIAWLNPIVTRTKFKQFFITFVILASLVLIARYGDLTFHPYFSHKAKSKAYLPARTITLTLTRAWHKKFPNSHLKYVGGTHYLASYLCVYNKNKPIPYLDWSLKQSPWINIKDLKKAGALFAWHINNNYEKTHLPNKIIQQFPYIHHFQIYYFKPATGAEVAKIAVGMTMLKPDTNKNHNIII